MAETTHALGWVLVSPGWVLVYPGWVLVSLSLRWALVSLGWALVSLGCQHPANPCIFVKRQQAPNLTSCRAQLHSLLEKPMAEWAHGRWQGIYHTFNMSSSTRKIP